MGAPQFSEKTDKLFAAMLAVQQECGIIGKDATNPHFKSEYASLENIWSTIKPICGKHGIMTMQTVGEMKGELVQVFTAIVHAASGQFVISLGEMPVGKLTPQAVGSAITYARRYFLAPALGLVTGDEDDDAEAAMGREQAAKKLGSLKTRKEDIIKWMQSHGNNNNAIKDWMSSILKREVDEKLTLRSEEEVVKLEEAVSILKKVEG